MKTKTLWVLLITFLAIPGLSKAQSGLSLSYVNSGIGTGGINLSYTKGFKQQQIGIGVRFNLYSLAHPDDQFKLYFKRLYADSFIENFGVCSYYQVNIFRKTKPVNIFLFTDIQLTYSAQRNRVFTPVGALPDGTTLYEESVSFFGPFVWLENTIGLGLNIPIYKNIGLTNKFGFGLLSVIGDKISQQREGYGIIIDNRFSSELTYTIQIGLTYTFK